MNLLFFVSRFLKFFQKALPLYVTGYQGDVAKTLIFFIIKIDPVRYLRAVMKGETEPFGRHGYDVTDSAYTPSSEIVAFALGSDPTSLFGAINPKKENISIDNMPEGDVSPKAALIVPDTLDVVSHTTELSEILNTLIDGLSISERDKSIVLDFFASDLPDSREIFKKIGDEYKIPAGLVRNTVYRAVRQLKAPPGVYDLNDYAEGSVTAQDLKTPTYEA